MSTVKLMGYVRDGKNGQCHGRKYMQTIKNYYWLITLVMLIFVALGFMIWMQAAHH